MRTRSKSILILFLAAILAAMPLGCRTPAGETPAQKRASVNKMRSADRSVGYAVFSSIGSHLLLLSTARGYGVLKDKSSGADTYMEMMSIGGGIGLGLKDYRVFMVFFDRDAMKRFKEDGIDFGGQGTATATTGEEHEEGIDLNAAQNVDSIQADMAVFQITEAGLSLNATLQGTKFSLSEELN